MDVINIPIIVPNVTQVLLESNHQTSHDSKLQRNYATVAQLVTTELVVFHPVSSKTEKPSKRKEQANYRADN